MTEKLYSKLNDIKVLLALFCMIIYCAGITLSGGSVLQLGLFWFTVLFYIILPGAFITRLLGLEKEINGYFKSLSFLLGTGFFAVVFCVCSRFSFWLPIKILPLALGIVALVTKRQEIQKYIQTKILIRDSQFALMALVYGGGIFLFTFLCVIKHAHPTAVGEITLSQDFMWTVGNAESFKLGFPPIDIRFSGVRLWYHYLTELLSSGISVVSGISSYNILGFYMQSFILLFFILAIYEFGCIYYENKAKANLFMLSFFTLSCLSLYKALPNGASLFSNSLLQTLLSNVNSQTTAFVYLSIFLGLYINASRKKGKVSLIYYATTFGAFFLLIFSKSPIAAIVIIALACAEIVSVIGKRTNAKQLLFALGLFFVFGLIYINLLSSGANHSTMFHLTKTMELGYFKNFIARFYVENLTLYKISIPVFMVLQTICIAPFQSVVVLPQMLKDSFKIFKLNKEKLWAYAAIVGGFAAFYISYHEAFSQVYFMYTGIFFFNLLAVEYFDFSKLKIKNAHIYLMLALSCITTGFMYINFTGSGLRQALRNCDIMEKYPYKYIVKSEDELAGEYLHKNMQLGEEFITNRIHTGAGEGLSNVYTCFSGKQAYMEGFKYTVSNMGVSKEVVGEKLKLVYEMFAIEGTKPLKYEDIKETLTKNSIKYIVYSNQFEGDVSQLENFEIVFCEGTVTIYKVA